MYYFDLPLSNIQIMKREKDLSTLTSRWEEIENFWQKEVAKRPELYNGFHLACNGIHVRKDHLVVYANSIEYKLDRFASSFDCHLPGTNTIGIGVFGYDAESQLYYLTKRSSSVSQYAEKIHIVGGVFEYTEQVFIDFSTAIKAMVKKELNEEIVLTQPFFEDKLQYLFAMYDEKTTALSFRFRYNGAFLKIANQENSELITVHKDQLLDFIKKNHARISVSTLRTLLWEHGVRLAEDMFKN